jgi:hypothetical protein
VPRTTSGSLAGTAAAAATADAGDEKVCWEEEEEEEEAEEAREAKVEVAARHVTASPAVPSRGSRTAASQGGEVEVEMEGEVDEAEAIAASSPTPRGAGRASTQYASDPPGVHAYREQRGGGTVGRCPLLLPAGGLTRAAAAAAEAADP